MFLTGKVIEEISIPDALLLSLVGFGVVFAALLAIIAIIKVITVASNRKSATIAVIGGDGPTAVFRASPDSAANAGKVPAPGSQGDIDLHTVDDPTAAILMAIVADDLKAPLNTLRFTSIREINQ